MTYAEHADDLLILVDSDDNEVGTLSKADCHVGSGVLHRAFSAFLFNEHGELLLQQRSSNKPLWPLIWANSCCSHPRAGEETLAAAHRRVGEELGIETELSFLFKFEYQAQYDETGAENELCWVFVGRFEGEPTVDLSEVAQWRFIKPAELAAAIEAKPEAYSPWLKLEWARILRDFGDKVPG